MRLLSRRTGARWRQRRMTRRLEFGTPQPARSACSHMRVWSMPSPSRLTAASWQPHPTIGKLGSGTSQLVRNALCSSTRDQSVPSPSLRTGARSRLHRTTRRFGLWLFLQARSSNSLTMCAGNFRLAGRSCRKANVKRRFWCLQTSKLTWSSEWSIDWRGRALCLHVRRSSQRSVQGNQGHKNKRDGRHEGECKVSAGFESVGQIAAPAI